MEKMVTNMENQATNITFHSSQISKEDYHRLNGHKSCILWFTGLSGAGKSTLAMETQKKLYEDRIRSVVLDGDNIRHGLNKDLNFSPQDRRENIRRIGEVSKLFINVGLIVLSAFISPYRKDRQSVRKLVEPGEFVEIYVKCALEECERRDPKGLYKKARQGQIKDFTGLSAPYEAPLKPELTIETDKQSLEICVEQIISYLEKQCIIGGIAGNED